MFIKPIVIQMSTVDRLFPHVSEYGTEGSPVVTIERASDSPEIACFDFIEYETKRSRTLS